MLKDVFLSVFEISLSTGLAVLALILLAPLLNKHYVAKWRYWIWVLFALRLVIPFKGTESIVGILAQTAASSVTAPEAGDTDAPPAETALSQGIVLEIPAQMTMPIVPQAGDNHTAGITPLDIAAAIWLAGCVAIVFLNIFSYQHYMGQIRKSGVPIDDSDILDKLQELKEELHIRGKISAIRYSGAASPMIIGFGRPVLVLPEEAYRPEELAFILKHELVHLKRGDVYVKMLLMASKAVNWFNPVIWMMQKEAVADMELSCDERVVQDTNFSVRKAYTETLFSTLNRACSKKVYFSTQFYGGKQIMKKRFLNILTRPQKRNGLFVLAFAMILGISVETMFICSAGNVEANPETTLAYIRSFDGEKLSFDTAEWIEVPSERAEELGITEDDWGAAGFYVYNEDTALSEFPLARDCVCKIFDWSISESHITVSAEGLFAVLEGREGLSDIIPYHLTIQDGQIIEIVEQYVP